MAFKTVFTFGIPLLPRACARDWRRVEQLLELTLASVFAQSDQDFRVLIAGHDRPGFYLRDPRIRFLQADWPVEEVRADNLDRGRKTWMVNREVIESGGGFLMLLDADDWVDRKLVATTRALLTPDLVGGVIKDGFAVDFQTRRAADIPDPCIFQEPFYRLCGSSAVLQIRPDSSDALLADPYAVLHEHYRVPEEAERHGVRLATLPVSAAYLINTDENHSEHHGPFADWRANFTQAVNRHGFPADARFTARFGINGFGTS